MPSQHGSYSLFLGESGSQFFTYFTPGPVFTPPILSFTFLDCGARCRGKVFVVFSANVIQCLQRRAKRLIGIGEPTFFHLLF